MEIPYIVTPRKDTGLFNSKIAIWLFLASEVMLFGGFFSAYVFLRIGADYPWPERTLPVLPGLINTFVLIGSSVTVVFAWAALKMREWRKFQIYMWITILCAGLFMVLKGIEYSVKFHHQAVRLNDYTIVEGHLGYELDEKGDFEKNYKGKKIEENQIAIEGTKFTFSTVRFHGAWVKSLADQAKHHGATIKLEKDVVAITEKTRKDGTTETIAKAGEELSVDLLDKIRDVHLKARKHNGALRTASLRKAWDDAYEANPNSKSVELAPNVNVDTAALAPKLYDEIASATFVVDKAVRFLFAPRDIREADGQSRLRDDTVIEGKLLASPMNFHYVDAIDFQYLAQKAVEKGVDPMLAIENSWLMKNDAFTREIWAWHKGKIAELEARLLKDYGTGKDGKPKREPTLKERYRIGWKEMVKYSEEKHQLTVSKLASFKEEFMGPNYEARNPHEKEGAHAGDHGGPLTFPHLSVPRNEIRFASKFTPSWNTYYAIYFTITGLHGLHVIGGAIVLGYYLFFGRKMYLSNPEWLANRVEVGGLFWHFVDLVWIFVFPVLYLM